MTDSTKDDRLTLNRLLKWLGAELCASDITLSGIVTDSRRVSRGDLFLALPGFAVDGRDYIEAAVQAGAAAVLMEPFVSAQGRKLPQVDVPLICVADLKDRSGELVDFALGCPSQKVKVIGVTGTNGKSSTVHFLGSLLDRLSDGCGIMGTLGKGRVGQLDETGNTTSDMLTSHRFAAELRDASIGWMAMEVSSHGLDQGRIDGLNIDTAIFTNLTREHLDYHGNMESYADAKGLLFTRPGLKYAIFNSDDEWVAYVADKVHPSAQSLTFSLTKTSADVYLQGIQLLPDGMRARIFTPWGEGELNTPLLGRFNLSNLLGVICALGCHGVALADVLEAVPSIESVPGRLERYGSAHQPSVVIDYAHTSDALDSVLGALREHGSQRITCVFGCGGDRDKGKRTLMAQAACAGADRVYLTSDNPRSEEPASIIRDALAGLGGEQRKRVTVVVDRAEAIRQAIGTSGPGDVVLVSGKGHESYQEIKGVRYPFSDLEQVTMALSGRVA
ncbi:UDP-N-acetylmuramoyl-L-alanyl-D-glutamate--2,6-diaminopimelate ligase [Sansalvadorimonas verongulae]|uniref:UDP-N-acetylmuramoyl-L-alanyl-D-glutamate--2, 6-diaminopimelate ligase n=1 Tax=Sansalvadorimonas verongulae TaxID=2172824 RepID=UPI0012BD649F|nr:UDP-N-acetylmuramoyl-L-alanyl-D-glutamate--2,6-diaminopimelate ligase [Sansalvadorimonas verongulae]MTI15247.1 UDP-N-acetylmuramoyl-L-alanyl-D-glutamate--2,6-diaminopimelate ligase [Sansalvadorimonas verongulae]